MPEKFQWNEISPMSTRRGEVAGVQLDNERLLIIGGFDGSTNGHMEGNGFDSGEIYDIKQEKWIVLESKLPFRRFGCSATNHRQTVYIIGAYSNNEKAATSMDILDVSTLKFAESIKMNFKRYYTAIVSSPSDHSLYLFGGLYARNIAERFDVRTRKWEKLPNLPRDRSYCRATRVGEFIYVFGEYNESDTIDVFHIKKREWINQNLPAMLEKRKGFTVNTLFDRFIFVCGGRHDNYNHIECTDIFDTKKRLWIRRKTTMTTPRSSHATIVVNKCNLIIAGGFVHNQVLSTAERISNISAIDCAENPRAQTLINDNEKGKDLLGLQIATKAIADCIARKDLQTPYTVAITGNWGSGKSFAKNLIIKELQEIQEKDLTKIAWNKRKDYPYVGHLYKVEFDAWTYAKSNIWSSLMTEILHQLNAQLDIESHFMNTFTFNTMLSETKKKLHPSGDITSDRFCKDMGVTIASQRNKICKQFKTQIDVKKKLEKEMDHLSVFLAKFNDQINEKEKKIEERRNKEFQNETTSLNEKKTAKKYVDQLVKVMNDFKIGLNKAYEANYQIWFEMMEIHEGSSLTWIQILFSSFRSSHDIVEKNLFDENWIDIMVKLENESAKSNIEKLCKKENDLRKKAILEAKRQLDKCKRMIKMDIDGLMERMIKIMNTTASWSSETSIIRKKKLRCDLEYNLNALKKDLKTSIEISNVDKVENDVLKSIEKDLIICSHHLMHDIPTLHDSLRKCYKNVEIYVKMSEEPSLLEKGVSTWRISSNFTSHDFEYLKMKVKDNPNIVNHLKQKRHATVSKALANVLNDTYERDRNELKDKENKLKQIVWENTIHENGSNISTQAILDYVYNANRKKYPETSLPASFDQIWNDLDIVNKLYIRLRLLHIPDFTILILLSVVIFFLWHYLSEEIKQTLWARTSVILGSTSATLYAFEKRFSAVYDNAKASIDAAFKYVYEKNSHHDLEAQNERIKQISKEVRELRNQVSLKEGDTLKYAIDLRLKESGSYEEHLQIVHKAQKDLNTFSEALCSPSNKKRLPRGDPRIFLFIDDLDRCAPDQIVQTLEAIKLLLRSPVFVVVLTADMRYLTSSVEQHIDFKNILKRNSCISGQEYVEKIIQITYHVPHINKEMMKRYLENRIVIENEEEEKVGAYARQSSGSSILGFGNRFNAVGSSTRQTSIDSIENKATYHPAYLEREVKCSRNELDIFYKVCYAARITPRCANRVTNSYKILKFIWRRTYGDNPHEEICNACMALLGLCAASTIQVRLDLQKAFSWLERDMQTKEGSFETYVKKHILPKPDRRWPIECIDILRKYLSVSWDRFEDDFWRARCFVCVGDYREADIQW